MSLSEKVLIPIITGAVGSVLVGKVRPIDDGWYRVR